jgi:EF-P beta-lysylation protein EpmB
MSQPVEFFPEQAIIVTDLTTADTGGEISWKKELAEATTSADALLKQLDLEHLISEIDRHTAFKCLVTDSFINKIQKGDINDPLLRQVLPLSAEADSMIQKQGSLDPVGDLAAAAAPGLLHKYHGRSLLISTGACAVHCRYCFRRHYPYQHSSCSTSEIDKTLHYLRGNADIEEIILSGGDPLVLDNEKLHALISRLESISHLQTLRIHTRLPVIIPSRIDSGLLALLKKTRFKVVLVTHINHANEIRQQEKNKCQLLHDAGITLFNQSVLLRGVNDNAPALIELSKKLFACRVQPYYLHLLDPVKGAMHFFVDRETAIGLHREMEDRLPGYLLPRLVQEIAGNRSKTAIFRN